MDDLVRWLGVQLDEDERIAKAAASLAGGVIAGGSDQWRASGSHTDNGGTYWSITSTSPDLDRISPVEMVGSGMSGGGAHTEEVADHIAEHDPARVLREIDAKRAIVDDLAEFIRWGARKGLDYQDGVDACERTLKRLALPYADRRGYQEAWRP